VSEPTSGGASPDAPRGLRRFAPSRAATLGWAVRRTLRSSVERPYAALWTLAAATCALFVIGAVALAATRLSANAAQHDAPASVVVYLGDGVEPELATQLVDRLRAVRGVERAELVPAAESARRLEQALVGHDALLDGVERASMPASVELVLAPGVRDVLAMSPLLAQLRGLTGVDDVEVDPALAQARERTGASPEAIASAGWLAALVVGAMLALVVLAVLRVRLDRPGNDVAVARLLGATSMFSFAPTALAGALSGAVAAALAAGAITAVLALCGDALASALGVAADSLAVAMPAAGELALLVGLGAAIGLCAGVLAGARRAAG